MSCIVLMTCAIVSSPTTSAVRKVALLARPSLRAGQVVDHVVRQAVLLGLLDRRQHAEDADAVRDEVRRVVGTHDTLAQRGGQERLEIVEDRGLRRRRRNQLHQVHVARRVEEVHAAEAGLQSGVQDLGELGDRQPRGVRSEDRIVADEGRDFPVEVVLPVHALCDRLDDDVAALEQLEVFLVVGCLDVLRVFLHAEWCRAELLQVLDGAQHDAVLDRPLRVRQVEQHDRNARIDAMRCDLRTHDAGAEHGDLAYDEIAHLLLHCSCGRRPAMISCIDRQNASAGSSIRFFAPERAVRMWNAVSGSSRWK